MNRPSNKGLHYDTNIDGHAFDDYIDNLEKYCDELEASIKYILLYMQSDNLYDECNGCMCKWYCKGEKSVLQEWCEQMDSKLFTQDDLPNCTELQTKWEPEFKKLRESHDEHMEWLKKHLEDTLASSGYSRKAKETVEKLKAQGKYFINDTTFKGDHND